MTGARDPSEALSPASAVEVAHGGRFERGNEIRSATWRNLLQRYRKGDADTSANVLCKGVEIAHGGWHVWVHGHAASEKSGEITR
jgi:hypothetical protein